MKQTVLASALLLAVAAPALAQPSPAAPAHAKARAEVLVLGVYHMANPGRDNFNMKADDVLSPRRQAEIARLVEALKQFHPTRIAVEGDLWDERIASRYADYVAGKHELSRNETEQIGYRLAKALGHKTVYPADADGEFPYPRLVNYAKGSGRSKELDAINAEVGVMVKAQDAYLASHTILETLLFMNDEEKVAEDVGFYYRFAHLGEPGDWAGADLVADYFRRNMRIYSNLVRLVDSPNERVLAIFGTGHLGWLRQEFASDPTIRLRTLAEFAK
jgi:hypothetical protein